MPDPIPLQIGQRIAKRRIDADLTQKEFGALADIDPTQLGKYERGLNDPSATTIVRVASAFGIDPGELIKGIGRESLPTAERSLQTVPQYLADRARQGGRPTRRGRNRL